MSEAPKRDICGHYQTLYEKYGYDERALGWSKHKQMLRFEQLFKHMDIKQGCSILDVGCGFGDLCMYLNTHFGEGNYSYYGIDIMESSISEAQKHYGHQNDTLFEKANILDDSFSVRADYVVSSGMFGFQLYDSFDRNCDYIREVVKKSLNLCRKGVAFDFLSDKVDYRAGNYQFHAPPEKMVEIAYSLSRRIILDNSAMPFEFTLSIFKDDSFNTENTVFTGVSYVPLT